jgi:5,10-methenyltetrahydrofolate synthetase
MARPESSQSGVRNMVRQQILQKRIHLDAKEREKANRAIHKNILARFRPNWKTFLVYVNMPEEVATVPLIKELLKLGKTVCVPSYDRTTNRYWASEVKDVDADLEPGHFNIPEPKPEARRPFPFEQLDAIVVPGVAFDREGNRLGHGYGYFDAISREAHAAHKIALAYHFQLVDHISTHSGDVPVQTIITEKEIIPCAARLKGEPAMTKPLTIFLSGDVVGEPGRRAIRALLPVVRKDHAVDLCIVNGENLAGGSGLTPKTFEEMRASGADVITTGDHIWDNKEILPLMGLEPRLLRPANFPARAAGRGSAVVENAAGVKIAVLNLMGRTFMRDVDCPFHAAEREVANLRKETPVIIIDMHAETTSEKIALARFLDGQVSAVIGTHTHVQTADEQIFPGGTAFLCDAGMTGPHDSILGREIEPIIQRFLTQMPQRFEVARHGLRLCGVLVRVDPVNGKALSIERVNLPLKE